jgi:hypothetical protein
MRTGVGLAIAPMTTLLYPLNGTADDGIIEEEKLRGL